MKILFPTSENRGAESPVYGHFGSADFFLVIDSENRELETFANPEKTHSKGICQPLSLMGGRRVDAVVSGGMGGGALRKLRESGIRVFRAVEGTVDENLRLIERRLLPEFDPTTICCGHAGEGGCGHH